MQKKGEARMDINHDDMIQEAGRQELNRLLVWITNNQEQWRYLCNQEYLELPVKEKLALMVSLEEAGLYSIAYVVFHTGWSRSRSMEVVMDRFVNGLAAELSADELMGRMKNAMQWYIDGEPIES